MHGLGKHRTLFGEWLDKSPFSQREFANIAGVSRETISKACSDDNYYPSPLVMRKIIKALRDEDPSFRAEQFWHL